MISLCIFLVILISQRVVEMTIARRHEIALKRRGAKEIDQKGYRVIVVMHTAFFISIFMEALIFDRHVGDYWPVLVFAFVMAQLLRYWAIASLGIYWNTKIIVAPQQTIVRKGPYKYLRHPNYIAVVTEIAVVPLIFSCYITAVVFTLLNAAILKRRVKIEMKALENRMDRKMPDGITT